MTVKEAVERAIEESRMPGFCAVGSYIQSRAVELLRGEDPTLEQQVNDEMDRVEQEPEPEAEPLPEEPRQLRYQSESEAETRSQKPRNLVYRP